MSNVRFTSRVDLLPLLERNAYIRKYRIKDNCNISQRLFPRVQLFVEVEIQFVKFENEAKIRGDLRFTGTIGFHRAANPRHYEVGRYRAMKTKWKRLNFSFGRWRMVREQREGNGRKRERERERRGGRGTGRRRSWQDCARVGREFRTWEFRPVARSRGTKRSAGLNVISRDTPVASYYPRSRRRRTTNPLVPPLLLLLPLSHPRRPLRLDSTEQTDNNWLSMSLVNVAPLNLSPLPAKKIHSPKKTHSVQQISARKSVVDILRCWSSWTTLLATNLTSQRVKRTSLERILAMQVKYSQWRGWNNKEL